MAAPFVLCCLALLGLAFGQNLTYIPCSVTANCTMPNNRSCMGQLCGCEIDYMPFNSTHCKRVDQNSSDTHVLPSSCNEIADCKNFTNTECHNSKCSCVKGHIPNANNTACVTSSNVTKSEPGGNTNSTSKLDQNVKWCINETCLCHSEFTKNPKNLTKGSNATVSELKCKECNNDSCICQSGYKKNETSCLKIVDKLNGTCNATTICYLEESGGNQTMWCNSGKCQCIKGYIEDETNMKCVSGAESLQVLSLTCIIFVLLTNIVM